MFLVYVAGDDSAIIQSLGITTSHTILFVWNGKHVSTDMELYLLLTSSELLPEKDYT